MLFRSFIGFLLASTIVASDGLTVASDGFYKMDFAVTKGTMKDVSKGFFSQFDNNVNINIEHFDINLKRDENASVTSDLVNQRAFYISDLNIGTPAKQVSVIVDTGSSDMWVMSKNNSYCQTNGGDIDCDKYGTYDEKDSTSFKSKKEGFFTLYLDHTFANGTWVQDTVEMSPGFKVDGANFGVAKETNSTIGVLGIGSKKLESSLKSYDNLPLQMKNQGIIRKNAYSLYLTSESRNGSILFGAIDHSKYQDNLVSFDIGEDTPQIPLSSITIENQPAIEVNDNVILDSGSSLTYLPSDITDKLINQVFNHVSYSNDYNNYIVPCSPKGNITFNFGDKKNINVPLTEIIVQVDQDVCISGIVAGDHSILGANFLRHVYSVFNIEEKTLSLAQINHTNNEDIEVIN